MRLDAVRVSFEGANLVIAGQGMPSETLGSGMEVVWLSGRQSPKLCSGLALDEHIKKEGEEVIDRQVFPASR